MLLTFNLVYFLVLHSCSYLQHIEIMFLVFFQSFVFQFFPTIFRDCEHEDEVVRDYLEGPEAQDPLVRKAMMNIWTLNDVTEVDWKQHEPDQSFFEV